MELTLNIEKKHLFALIIIFALAGLAITYAYGGTPATNGHSNNEIDVSIGGVTKTLQNAIDDKSLIGNCRVVKNYNAGGMAIATCPTGVAVSGGVSCTGAFFKILVSNSTPTNNGKSWGGLCRDMGGNVADTNVFAVCC